ncbi:MAG TPA: Gfo/Idh/MocA family oxidoreductase [Kofleriaceae bacterium]|nr:Gfo/Idh/MocA family oxidoreductase [Kofleriaceae bacterium]
MPSSVRLRGAIAGFGFIAEKGHLPAYLSRPDRFAIVAVADICEARRRLAERLIPGVRTYATVTQLLDAEAKHLDFVDIATPPSDHASIAHAAFDRGLHVFCEKPIATSAKDAQAMLDHAVAARRVFFPSHNYKHAPVIKAVRDLLDRDAIGEVHLVTLDTFRTTHAKGVSDWLPDWRRMKRYSGGGIAMDHGSHTFYLAFDWLASYPTAITAHMNHRGAFDTEDNFNCTLTFPTGTAVAQLTWNAGVRKVQYTLHGERGAIIVEDDDIELTVRGTGAAQPSVERMNAASNWMDASHAAWFRTLQEEFATAIAIGDLVGKNAREAYLCVQLIETAYASSRAGSRLLPLVSLEEPAAAVG